MSKLPSLKIHYITLLLLSVIIDTHSIGYSLQESQIDYIPVTFESEGSKLCGRFFKAVNTKPATTIILLHGFPGSAGDLFGLGKRLKEEGINAFVFNFRGSWKSEGIFLPENSLNDVITSVTFLKSPDICKKFNIDTTRIILLGYSTGSSMALLGSLAVPSVEKVISLGTTDFSVLASRIENNEDYRKAHQATLDKIMSDSTVIRSIGGKATHEYLIAHKDNFSLIKHANELANKQILLIGGWNDYMTPVEEHSIPFYRALQKYNAKNIKFQLYDTDHYFTTCHEQLYRDILEWIKK